MTKQLSINAKRAYVTVLANDKYIPGVKALKKSVRKVNSKYDLVILVPKEFEQQLNSLLLKNRILDKHCHLYAQPFINITYQGDVFKENHYWQNTFFKLQVANLTQFEKIVLLDSDMMIMHNIDSLFETEHYSAAVAGQAVTPEYENLNSGLMVLEPSETFYKGLLGCIEPAIKRRLNAGLNIGDQDVFQEFYPDWKENTNLKLPEIYNVFWQEVDKFCQITGHKKDDINVIHFIGEIKPWQYGSFTKENILKLYYMLRNKRMWHFSVFARYLLY